MKITVNNIKVELKEKNDDKVYSKDDAYKTLDITNMWIENVDSKISYALAFIGILLGFIVTGDQPMDIGDTLIDILYRVSNFFSSTNIVFNITIEKNIIALLLLCASTVTAIISIVYLLIALKGSISLDEYNEDGLTIKSNIFWGSVSKKKYKDFKHEVLNISEDGLMNDITSQIFINSKICNKKFENYNKGIRYIIFTVIIFFIYNFIISILF